jgi:hypothetical protein|tara:strand:+ start:150 stop:1562 length:1413 start_codon:yes stop_codon:yes gene_type:complete
MIFQKFEDIDFNNFPVIIFGSGPAGMTVALELEKKNISSVIIEAGESEYNINSQDQYNGKIIGDNIADLSSSRLRQLGGTSGHWGGWSKPMEAYNFKNWPIEKEDLDPYQARTCSILNIKNQFKKTKLNNYFNQIEFRYSSVRFAEKYMSYIQKSKKIHLILNCQLSHFEGSEKKVQSAICLFNNSSKKIKSKYFILACGGIENSRILLWTKEKNVNLINKNLPIGEYWMNHPWIISGIGLINKKKLKSKLNDQFLDYEGPLHFAASKNLIEEKKILSAAIYMNAKEDTKLYKEIIKDILCIAPKYGKKISHLVFKKDLKCGNIFMNIEEPPSKNNRIKLDPYERDKLNIPIVNLFYKKSKDSLLAAKIFLEEFGSFCINEDLGRIAAKENIYNLDDFENMGGYHHLGGTSMGIDKSISVVNSKLKVHDIDNLYIAGSSNFTTGGYTNPTYTIIQLSLRLADELHSKLNT